MRTLTISAISLVLFAFVISGCKKDKKETPTPTPALTKTQMITAKPWKVTAVTVSPAIDWDGQGTMVTDIYSQMDACEKDDLVKFNTNGSYTLEEGTSVCVTGDPQVYETGTWAFNSNETALTITPSGSTVYSYDIVSLSSTTLTYNEIYNDGTTNYTYTVTMTAQ